LYYPNIVIDCPKNIKFTVNTELEINTLGLGFLDNCRPTAVALGWLETRDIAEDTDIN
jgi:hypothetical protein